MGAHESFMESKETLEDIMYADMILTAQEVSLEDIMQMEDEWDREDGIYERIVASGYAR